MPSSTRFLGVLNRPDTETNPNPKPTSPNPLDELDESDVVWSSSTTAAAVKVSADDTAIAETQPISTPSSPFSVASSTSPIQFPFATSGLSAAIGLTDPLHRSPVVQRRKTAMSPLLSPAGAAAVAMVMAPPSPSSSPVSRSAPVKVPIWPARRRRDVMGGFEEEEEEEGVEEEEEEEEMMVPPHEIVARSHRTTTFSVFEGVGRTLKGRDLTRVRNAVMQKTGFLE